MKIFVRILITLISSEKEKAFRENSSFRTIAKMQKLSRNINCEKVQKFREKNNAKISPKNNTKKQTET